MTRMGRGAWVAAGLSILGLLVAGVIWLGTLNAPDGDDLITSNVGPVLIAIVSFVGLILSVVLPQVAEVKRQVANDHKKPDGSPLLLRDDMDVKHDVIVRAIEGLAADMRGIRRDVGRNADRTEYIAQRLDQVIDQVNDLEDTVNPKETS